MGAWAVRQLRGGMGAMERSKAGAAGVTGGW